MQRLVSGLAGFFRRWRATPAGSDEKIEIAFFGLGNPGEQYAHTRHNIGFRVIDAFVETLAGKRQVAFPDAEVIIGKTAGGTVVAAVKPLTFMNNSGAAVNAVIRKWDVAPERCLVVVDDFHLPLGTIRLRRNGSDGGHNGLKSIIGLVGSGFPRLRIGVGPIAENTGVIDFVLGNFTDTEEKELIGVQKKSIELLTTFAAENIDAVMNKYN